MTLGSRCRSALRHGSPDSSSLHLAATTACRRRRLLPPSSPASHRAAGMRQTSRRRCAPARCLRCGRCRPTSRGRRMQRLEPCPTGIPTPRCAWEARKCVCRQDPCLALLQPSALHMLPDGVRQLSEPSCCCLPADPRRSGHREDAGGGQAGGAGACAAACLLLLLLLLLQRTVALLNEFFGSDGGHGTTSHAQQPQRPDAKRGLIRLPLLSTQLHPHPTHSPHPTRPGAGHGRQDGGPGCDHR